MMYEVEITNFGNINEWIKSISATMNNENMIYEVSGVQAQEDIIYSPNENSQNSTKTFTITFSYKDSIKNENNDIQASIHCDIDDACNRRYIVGLRLQR